MRGTISLPAARDREALERIDSDAFYRLCQLYQAYMSRCAKAVVADQMSINKQISEVILFCIHYLHIITIVRLTEFDLFVA